MANPLFRVHGAGCGLGAAVFPRGNTEGTPPAYAGAVPDFQPGGTALASLTLAAQLLKPAKVPVSYYGLSGDDAAAARIRTALARTPLDMSWYRQRPGRTPTLSVSGELGPAAATGFHRGTFDPGTAVFDPELLGQSFFQATCNVYAGTALTPRLHQVLPTLLAKSRRRGAFTVMGAVDDVDAEAAGRPWTLGDGEAWPHLDLIVADEKGILKLAEGSAEGRPISDVADAVETLLEKGLSAAVVMRASGSAYYRSAGGIFGESRGDVPAWSPSEPGGAGTQSRVAARHGEVCEAAQGGHFLGALVSAFFFQILSDDFFPKGELHLERELFHMNPLHLRKAVEFATVAEAVCSRGRAIEVEKAQGERLKEIRARLPEPELSAKPW